MTPEQINWALESGFNIVCSTCSHLHESLSKNQGHCGKVNCGGPVYNRDFPDYNGAIPRDDFKKACLVCANQNISHFIIINGKKTFALCKDHVNMMDEAIDRHTLNNVSAKGAVVSKPLIVPAYHGAIDV